MKAPRFFSENVTSEHRLLESFDKYHKIYFKNSTHPENKQRTIVLDKPIVPIRQNQFKRVKMLL